MKMPDKEDEIKKLVCFIDLLGTKESSRVSGDDYSLAINKFKETLKSSQGILPKGKSEIRLFSDCAFMAMQSPSEEVIDFLDNIRTMLFSEGCYFKCSLNPGEFVAEEDNDIENCFSSVTFPTSAVESYLLHEQFKGLGYIISPKVLKATYDGPTDALDSLVSSVYIGGPNRNEVIRYHDVPFRERFIGNNEYSVEKKEHQFKEGSENDSAELHFEKYLQDFMIAKTKNEAYAIYYLPSIITMIRSSDFKDIHYSKEDSWTGTPLIFYKLFVEFRTLKKLLSIPRSEIIYCAAIEKVYEDNNIDFVKNFLAEFFSKYQKIKKGISNVPSFVFKSMNRNDFIARIAKYELSK